MSAKASTVVLQPIAMVTPTKACIYAPSRLRQEKSISFQKFLQKYADSACSVMVSFEPDGKSQPRPVTAYGFGLDCWYIISGELPNEDVLVDNQELVSAAPIEPGSGQEPAVWARLGEVELVVIMKIIFEAISPGGYRVLLETECELDYLRRLADLELFLEQEGFRPAIEPPRTPDGLPICRKHGAVMKARSKQGDSWFSHLVILEDGQELWCKGRPGADSPGWEH